MLSNVVLDLGEILRRWGWLGGVWGFLLVCATIASLGCLLGWKTCILSLSVFELLPVSCLKSLLEIDGKGLGLWGSNVCESGLEVSLSFMVIIDSLTEFKKARLTNFGGEFITGVKLGMSRASTHGRLWSFSLPVLDSLFLFAERDSLPSVGRKR